MYLQNICGIKLLNDRCLIVLWHYKQNIWIFVVTARWTRTFREQIVEKFKFSIETEGHMMQYALVCYTLLENL